jgi:predicted unusual protein kinase regulating ubiquinone biosynthesis (AarF/ABC1/UbiB family)
MAVMSMPDDELHRIDALIQVAIRLVSSTTSGRILLAKAAAVVDPDLLQGGEAERLRAALDGARTAIAEPLPLRAVEAVLGEAWGTSPADELDDLDPVPVATSALAQVHRATLDGAPVAVKVLRPGIAGAVRRDLALADGLLTPLAAALPRIDAQALLRELRERALDELDLEHVAGVQRRLSRALRGHPALAVPAPVMRLAHETVLVSEWVEGVALHAIEDARERTAAAESLAVFVLGGLRSGLAYAGANPADVVVAPDGRLTVLDLAPTAAVEPERAAHLLAAVDAFAAGDGDALGAALGRLELLAPRRGADALAVIAHALGPLGGEGPAALDRDALRAVTRRLGERSEDGASLLVDASLPPRDLWPLRGLGQLFATIARIGATASWRRLTAAALRDGWNAAA